MVPPDPPSDAPPAQARDLRRRRDIDILTADDVRALMTACPRRAPTGVRNRALIALLYGSGLRISEALALRPKDVDLGDLAVSVQSGKGRRRRVAALVPDTVDAILRWIDRRDQLGLRDQQPLFCTTGRGAAGMHPTSPGGTLSREYFARVLRRLARKAGVGKRVHPHGFRHSHADLLRRRGWDVEEIRRQLGHRSLEVTSQYLDHIGAHELPQKIRMLGAVLEPRKAARRELSDLLARLGEQDVEQIVALLKRAGG